MSGPGMSGGADIALLPLAAVALKLGVSRERFYKRWKAMVAEHGFPPPVPGCGKRWDPVAIRRWLDAQMPAHLRPPVAAAAEAEAADLAAELRERARALAPAAAPA